MAPLDQKRRRALEKALSEADDEPSQIDRIAEIRGWFRPDPNSIFYPAVQEYVRGAADLHTTVAKITAPIDEALSESKRDQINVVDLWYSILHSAKRVPYREIEHRTKLVDLLKAIKEHPEPPSPYEDPTYSSLSGLSLAVREAYNDAPDSDQAYPPEIHAWANFNYFLARMTESQVYECYPYAIWAMREALEKTPEPRGRYDVQLQAAAVWIFGLGKKLYEREEDLTPQNPNQGNPARGGDLWAGGPVFSKERWAFWKRRFGELQVRNFEGVSVETKAVAREAVEAMEEVESP